MSFEPDSVAADEAEPALRKMGRPRKWSSEAERKRAYRERLAADLAEPERLRRELETRSFGSLIETAGWPKPSAIWPALRPRSSADRSARSSSRHRPTTRSEGRRLAFATQRSLQEPRGRTREGLRADHDAADDWDHTESSLVTDEADDSEECAAPEAEVVER
ncbi:MAG: hypothetical protein U0Q07_08180 [Acidimicrobiales bacterium]